eukprot:768630-Hanusia_phi.AAC.3
MKETARALGAEGKGILAADESIGTIGKRFSHHSIENNEMNRRKFRQMLLTAPDIEKYISGVILFEESLYQQCDDGTPFLKLLQQRGMQVGIKVDTGVVEIPGTCGETSTTGLDGLAQRCAAYYKLGARFAKWRAVLRIDERNGCPSALAIQDNAWCLARFAAVCQSQGLTPLIEPDILIDGSHSIERCSKVTERVLAAVFKALIDNHVSIEAIVLLPNMVRPGSESIQPFAPLDVAEYTVRTLMRVVPSGRNPSLLSTTIHHLCSCLNDLLSLWRTGDRRLFPFRSNVPRCHKAEDEATNHLRAIVRKAPQNRWATLSLHGLLTLCRTQSSALKAWGGEDQKLKAAAEVGEVITREWVDRSGRSSLSEPDTTRRQPRESDEAGEADSP